MATTGLAPTQARREAEELVGTTQRERWSIWTRWEAAPTSESFSRISQSRERLEAW